MLDHKDAELLVTLTPSPVTGAVASLVWFSPMVAGMAIPVSSP